MNLRLLLVGALMMIASCAPAKNENVVKEVAKLVKAQVTEDVVLAYIEKQGAPVEVSADDLIELKKAGASDRILVALMQGKGGTATGSSSGRTAGGGEFPFDLDPQYQVGRPVVSGALAVYPILRKGPDLKTEYRTLDEATRDKVIVIKEMSDPSVPVVIVMNSGRVPIYVSAGEIIVGGKQDRVISHDIVIDPGKELRVDVKCVEHGRWENGRVNFESSGLMAGNASRKAAQFKGQSDVWNEVATQNAAVRAAPNTGTYKAAFSAPEIKEATDACLKAVLPKLEGRNCVGMVVVIGSKVHAIEIFGSPSLFGKLKEKLLKGFVLDGISSKETRANPPGKDRILEFYKSTQAAQAEELKRYERNVNYKRMSPAAVGNESRDDDGKLLHKSYLSH
jgi:hypothetical protein